MKKKKKKKKTTTKSKYALSLFHPLSEYVSIATEANPPHAVTVPEWTTL